MSYYKFIFFVTCLITDVAFAGDLGYMLDSEERECEYDDSCENILPYIAASVIVGYIARLIDKNVERNLLNRQSVNIYASLYFIEFCAIICAAYNAKNLLSFLFMMAILQLWVFIIYKTVQEFP